MILAVLPTPEQVKAVRKAAARGVRPSTIAERVFGHWGKTPLVNEIIANPTAFSHDVDEVAVARALQGDEEVWENLTHLERRTVILRALERRRQEHGENLVWQDIYRRHRGRADGLRPGPAKGEPNPFPYESVRASWVEPLLHFTGHRTVMEFMDHARLIEKRAGVAG